MNYGDVWTVPAKTLNEIRERSPNLEKAFHEALSMGYFSQYTSYKQKGFIEKLSLWQADLLAQWIGPKLQDLPIELEELPIVPDSLIVELNKRKVSPDLLRNLWYVLYLLKNLESPLPRDVKNILEIGSGYGCFARIIKTYIPSTCVWLVDLPESLSYAHTYLKAAFPKATIAIVNNTHSIMPNFNDHDFILVPVDCAEKLQNHTFELAVNIWSFGEMPNTWISYWLDLIQVKCQVDRMFLLNAFGSPVTSKSIQRAEQGDWLFKLDKQWEVHSFQLNPSIHCCPLVKNFYTGVGIYCQRVSCSQKLDILKSNAMAAVHEVFMEDWVSIVMNENGIGNHDSIDTLLNEVSLTKLLAITEYIGCPRIKSDTNSAFYKLWNDFRLNTTPITHILLLSYLAMVHKSELNHRCSKEEIFLLKRLPNCKLHNEYGALLLGEKHQSQVVFQEQHLSIQAACDMAYQIKNNVEVAEQLLIQVAIKAPRHGDCWYHLALIYRDKGQVMLAMVMALHALHLDSTSNVYSILAKELMECLKTTTRIERSLIYLLNKIAKTISSRNIIIHHVLAPTLGYLSGRNRSVYLKQLGNIIGLSGAEELAHAIRKASEVY